MKAKGFYVLLHKEADRTFLHSIAPVVQVQRSIPGMSTFESRVQNGFRLAEC